MLRNRLLGTHSWAIGSVQSRITLRHPKGVFRPRDVRGCYLSHLGRRGRPVLPVCAALSDPDDYEIDFGYDSDDYELFDKPGVAPPRAPKSSTVGTTSQKGLFVNSKSFATVDSIPYPRRRHNTPKALKSGLNIFILFGAAIDRFVSHLHAAFLAACTAVLSPVRRGTAAASIRVRASFRASPAGRTVQRWRQAIAEVQRDLPDDAWGKLLWLWDRPPVQRLRLTVSMANLSIRLPALLALVATQVGLLASQVSLPMLAPLLLGTGMLLRSIKSNASFLFPRIGLVVVMLWMLWFANSVIQNTVAYLRKQGALDDRLAGGIITVSEVSALLVAMVVLLSMLGVNVSALLLPAGIAVAVAAKDLAHNFLAGFFLFVVQPFKLGDRLAISSSPAGMGVATGNGWFEGICERVDLRYTIVRQGRRRLVVPNSAFLTREFMVLDDVGAGEPSPQPPAAGVQYPAYPQPFLTNDHRHVWQYVEGPPVHQELATAARPPGQSGMEGGRYEPGPPPYAPPTPSQEEGNDSTRSGNAPPSSSQNGSTGRSATHGMRPGTAYGQPVGGGYYVPFTGVPGPPMQHPANLPTTTTTATGAAAPSIVANSYWQVTAGPPGSYMTGPGVYPVAGPSGYPPPPEMPSNIRSYPLGAEFWDNQNNRQP